MSRKIKLILFGFFIGIVYFGGVKVSAYFFSRYYAKNLSQVLSSNNIDAIDKFFKDNPIISVENEERRYKECRENVKAACISGIPIEADSYGYYSGKIQKKFTYGINIAFNRRDVEGSLELIKSGVLYRINKFQVDRDVDGIVYKVFFGNNYK